ncbi:MAG: PEGA domain-containing protein [Candidatus Omnitrophica bacterium]|nr:PEGA domain-containing protein [Candidatus Omnitrophota bacterium]MDD5488518.1 PEGA domain-containing protein [Candidatus Omnitrophota bacterium]
MGYIYKPGDKNVIKTGLIYLATAPEGATVYLNGEKQEKTTPVMLLELTSGSYNVKAIAENYRPWDQTVPVEKEKATVLDKVLLIPSEWAPEAIMNETFSKFLPVPGTDIFLMAKDAGAAKWITYNYVEDKITPLFEDGSPFRDYTVSDVKCVKGDTSVLLALLLGAEKKYVWLELNPSGNKATDVTELFLSGIDTVSWFRGSQNVFSLNGGNLERIDVKEGAIYPEYINKVKGYGLEAGRIYTLTEDNLVKSDSMDLTSEEDILEDPSLGGKIFRDIQYDIRVISDDFMIFLGEDGDLIASKLPYRFTDEKIKDVKPAAYSKRLLVWSKSKVGLLDFSTELTGYVGFEKPPLLVWLYENGQDIDEAFWVFSEAYVLVKDAGKISLVEIETYGEFPVAELFTVDAANPANYSEKTGSIYYIDGQDNVPRSIKLIPDRPITPVPGTEGKKNKDSNGE